MMFKKALTYSFAALVASLSLSSPNMSLAQSAFDDPKPETESNAGAGRADGDFIAVQNNVEAGEIAIGASSKVLAFFRNESREIITVEDLSLYPSSNVLATVSSNECGETALTPGAECAIILNVQGSQPGSYRVSLLLKHTGVKRLVSANITGEVVLQAEGAKDQSLSELETGKERIDFGSVTSTRPIIEAITLKNISSDPITVENIKIESSKQSGLSLSHGCGELQSNQVCLISVKWEPQVEGLATGFVAIEHTGRNKIKYVPLRGLYEASDAPDASLFPSALPGKGLLISDITEFDFGSDVENDTLLTATLINVGDAPLSFKGIEVAGGTSTLKVLERGCPEEKKLEPTQACPIILKWSPTYNDQVLSDAMHINHTGTRGLLMLPITGQGKIEKSAERDTPPTRNPDSNTPPMPANPNQDFPLPAPANTPPRLDLMDDLLEELTSPTNILPLPELSLEEEAPAPEPVEEETEPVSLPIVPSAKPINPEDLEPVETFSFNNYMISALSNTSAILTGDQGIHRIRFVT